MRPCVLNKIIMSWKDHKEKKIEMFKKMNPSSASFFFTSPSTRASSLFCISAKRLACASIIAFRAAWVGGDFRNGKIQILSWKYPFKKKGVKHSESNPSLNLPKSNKVFFGGSFQKGHIISSELFSALHFCKTCPSNISFLSFVKPVVFLSPASIGRPLLPSAFEAAASSLCDWRNPEWRKRTKVVRVGW